MFYLEFGKYLVGIFLFCFLYPIVDIPQLITYLIYILFFLFFKIPFPLLRKSLRNMDRNCGLFWSSPILIVPQTACSAIYLPTHAQFMVVGHRKRIRWKSGIQGIIRQFGQKKACWVKINNYCCCCCALWTNGWVFLRNRSQESKWPNNFK